MCRRFPESLDRFPAPALTPCIQRVLRPDGVRTRAGWLLVHLLPLLGSAEMTTLIRLLPIYAVVVQGRLWAGER